MKELILYIPKAPRNTSSFIQESKTSICLKLKLKVVYDLFFLTMVA